MKTITIRKIPPELAKRLQAEAEEEGASLARTVIRLLLRATGLSPDGTRRTRWHDLDELAGTWEPEDANRFERSLADQRPIDPEIWS